MKTNGINISAWVNALGDERPYYLAIIDEDGHMNFTNSRYYTNFLSQKASVSENSFFDHVHEKDRARFGNILTACASRGNTATAEIRVKNESPRRIKWEVSCVKKIEEHPDRFLCLGYEIAVEDKLKANMQEFGQDCRIFNSFMDHTPYFTWIVDTEENLIFANTSLLEYFDLDTTAFGEKLEDVIPSAIARFIHEKHMLVLAGNQQHQGIVKSLMSDGKEHIYQVILFPIPHLTSGRMVGGQALDITETYQARQREKRASERLLYLSKATSEAIWDWNLKSGQIYFNLALHDLVGTELGQVFDLNWCFQRVHTDDRKRVEEFITSVLEKRDQSWEVEYRFQIQEGQFKTMLHRGFVIYEDNEPIRMIGSLQDVSEIRDLETQLIKQKLKQQKGVAEAIIRAQEDERTRIGHELHDNVNQILSSAQLYLNHLNPEADDFWEVKEKTLEIIKLGIEEIRQLSRAMVVPNLNQEGLVASIEELVEDLRFADLFYVSFSHSKSSDIELISQSKKVTLFRIIQEQTKNIIKYSKAKNVEISVQCCSDQIRLEIADDGKGFDPQTTRRGLGLSNIYERTRLYNGKVLLTSAPGKGCSIIVNLPFEARDMSLMNIRKG